MKTAIHIRPIQKQEQTWAGDIIADKFGSRRIVSRDKLHDTEKLPAIIALSEDEPVGILHYHIENKDCEVVTIISLVSGQGVGRKLLEAVKSAARKASCNRVWLITTNDNISAQNFYHHLGWNLVAVHHNAVQKARQFKPEIPELGENSIPINDEIEFEWKLRE